MVNYDRYIGRHPSGDWTVRGADSRRFNSRHKTREEAIETAESHVKHFGKGRVIMLPNTDLSVADFRKMHKMRKARLEKRGIERGFLSSVPSVPFWKRMFS